MALSVEQFVENVVASGLMSADEAQDALAGLSQPPADGEAFAKSLVRSGRLTRYQASMVFRGKVANLILGEYVLLDKLGAGGMGQVFKAEHRVMRRVVALKILAPSLMKLPGAVKRFHREVQAVARLHHPNIVIAHDAGEAGGIHFLVMEFVEGNDLSNIVRRNGPLSVEQAVACILQAARGLEHAHGEGIVHRDVKPANLLMDPDGVIKILDLGLASFERDQAAGKGESLMDLTGSGVVMGTIDYMAPEQAVSTHSADGHCDVYSLGCTLYFLLTGQKVYEGETAVAKILAHRDEPIPSLSNTRDDVPLSLDSVFHGMVAKHPDERYQSMGEVIAALKRAIEGADEGLGDTSIFSFSGVDDSHLASFLRGMSSGDALARTKRQTVVDHTLSSRAEQPTEEYQSQPTAPAPGPQARALRKAERQQRRVRHALFCGVAISLVVLLSLVYWLLSGSPDSPHETDDPTLSQQSGEQTSTHGLQERKKPPTDRSPVIPPQSSSDFAESIGVKLVSIPAGEFLMGSTQVEVEKVLRDFPSVKRENLDNEQPQHRVRITKPFLLSAHEVTVGQFRQFVNDTGYKTEAETDGEGGWGWNETSGKFEGRHTKYSWRSPGFSQGDNHPVVNVSWNDAIRFCEWLSGKDGRRFRLPSEAEWEYACRAGTTTRYHSGDDPESLARVANVVDAAARAKWTNYQHFQYLESSDGYVFTAPVGSFRPNAWGLYDLHGNVWEWCADWYATDYYKNSPAMDPQGPNTAARRVLRRGGCIDMAQYCRSATRDNRPPDNRINYLGFRVAAVPRVRFAESIGVKLVSISAGEFLMGTTQVEVEKVLRDFPGTERENVDDEQPQHRVRISRPFMLAAHELTVGQFRQFVNDTGYKTEAERDDKGGYGWNESTGRLEGPHAKYTWRYTGFLQRDDEPVVNVTWNDAVKFCQWLSRKDGRTFRLPSEAEWEYACRAGTTTRYHSGDDPESLTQVGNVPDAAAKAKLTNYQRISFLASSDGHVFTAPVGSYHSNGWGLFDMHGNVMEWCGDWAGAYKDAAVTDPKGPNTNWVFRGGSWSIHARGCRSADRHWRGTDYRYVNLGFRVVAVP